MLKLFGGLATPQAMMFLYTPGSIPGPILIALLPTTAAKIFDVIKHL